jgi:RHS repeat-associated protein
VLKQAAPGTDWALRQGHEIKLDYQTNTDTEVKLYQSTTTWNAGLGLYDIAFSDNGNYNENQLYKNVTYDENTTASPTESAGSTVEFKNKEGQVVLKRTYESGAKHDTYYVYDIYGNLTYVIPPKADATITTTILDDLCYQYKYDSRNRLVEKKLPGKQWEFIVYDKLDRPVATGPAFSPFQNDMAVGWLITKHDAFGRPVYTGWNNTVAADTSTRKSLQDAQNGATVLFETKQTSGTIDGIAVNYSNAIAPTSFKLLTVNYYDDYVYPNAPAVPTTIEGQTVLVNAKSLSTGSWTRTLTIPSAMHGETAITFYDPKARPIRSYITNYLGGCTYTDSKLDFTGKTLYTLTKHKRVTGETELSIKEEFTYSPQDRLLTHTHQINGGAIQLLADNTYDELGQLIAKNVGNNTGNPLQKVNYSYNIRGWLTEINKTDNLQQSSDPKDLFGFKINYNKVNGDPTVAKALYNGNIAETFWSTGSDGIGIIRAYGYKYDQLNRLKDATYQTPTLADNKNYFGENLDYDKNGNITRLQRKFMAGVLSNPYDGDMDNLSYSYNTNSNQLMKVTDSSNETAGFKDDSNGFNDTVDDYGYDFNGNMIKDDNKGITLISYNHLNLPKKITFGATGTIDYIYNAAGQKLEKIVTEGLTITSTNYLGGYQYQKPHLGTWALQFFPTAEGYVKNTIVSSDNNYSYVFNYTDHLGNVRLSYSDGDKNGTIATTEIVEESNYYPFGLKHSGYNGYVATDYKYKFNGKELQDDDIGGSKLNMYDYGARNYDPALGRWMNVDPLAEKFPSCSPYSFSFNNPIVFVDPDGRAPLPYNDDIITKVSNKKGDAHYVQREVSMRMTLTVVNSNGADLSKTMFNKSAGSVQLSSLTGVAQKDFRGNDVYASDNLKNVSVDYKVVSSLKDVGKNDHVMMLVNDIPKTAKGVDPVGLATEGGRVSAVEIGTIKNSTFNQAAQHEIEHNLGLDHKNGGLMNPSIISGSTSTSPAERGNILYNQVGPLQGNGTYTQSQNSTNYSTRIQTQANDFLSRNKIK